MARTDIPNPTALDEAIWTLHVACLEDPSALPQTLRRRIGGAALMLFPLRYDRLAHKRAYSPRVAAAVMARNARWRNENRERYRELQRAHYSRLTPDQMVRKAERAALAWERDPEANRAYQRDWRRQWRAARKAVPA